MRAVRPPDARVNYGMPPGQHAATRGSPEHLEVVAGVDARDHTFPGELDAV